MTPCIFADFIFIVKTLQLFFELNENQISQPYIPFRFIYVYRTEPKFRSNNTLEHRIAVRSAANKCSKNRLGV